VSAVDVSATALDRAAVDAATAGVADRIEFRRHDLALAFPPAPSISSRPSTCNRR
jgi:23S rRNA G2445 N2-methylase RlmL